MESAVLSTSEVISSLRELLDRKTRQVTELEAQLVSTVGVVDTLRAQLKQRNEDKWEVV